MSLWDVIAKSVKASSCCLCTAVLNDYKSEVMAYTVLAYSY